jgi:SPP1 family predicted phage head-tail adaptor
MLRSGLMNRRLQLLRRGLTRNETTGEDTETFEQFAEVWAQKADSRGREFFAAQQVNSAVTLSFRIRFRTDLTSLDRCACDGVTYNIEHIAEIGQREGLEIFASTLRR